MALAFFLTPQALQQANRFGLADAGLIVEIADAYAALGRHSDARALLGRAARLRDGAGVRCRLAGVCLDMGDHAACAEQIAAAKAVAAAAGGDAAVISEVEARLKALWPSL